MFFRWVKQTLNIRHFVGTSENAVRLQIAVALIAFVLLRLAQATQDAIKSPLAFARLVRTNLMHRRRIDQLLRPETRPKGRPEKAAGRWPSGGAGIKRRPPGSPPQPKKANSSCQELQANSVPDSRGSGDRSGSRQALRPAGRAGGAGAGRYCSAFSACWLGVQLKRLCGRSAVCEAPIDPECQQAAV